MATSPSPQTWAVTGATGLLGNNLVRMLLDRGARVRVIVRGENRKEIEGLDVEVINGDLRDESALMRCFAGANVVVHSAAMVWIGHSALEEMQSINVGGTEAVCKATPEGARLVHVSTVDAIGFGTKQNPADEDRPPEHRGVPYPDTKRAADDVVRGSGLDYVIVRPTYMLGPWDWKPSSGQMVLSIAGGLGRFPPPGANNYVHVRDVCEGIIAAAAGPRGREWILGNENLTYAEVWQLMAETTGAPGPWFTLPRFLGGPGTFLTGLPHRLGLKEGLINGATTHFGFVDHCFDPSRARRELGLAATPIPQAIEDAWGWFKAHRYL